MKQYRVTWFLILMFLLAMMPFMMHRAEGKANNDAIVYLPVLSTPAGKWIAAYQRIDNSSLGGTLGIQVIGQNRFKLIGDNFVINLKGDGTVDNASYVTSQGRLSAKMSAGRYVKGYPNIFYECDALIHMFDQSDANLWTRVVKPPVGSCYTSLDLSSNNDSIIFGQQFNRQFLGHNSWLAKLDENGDLAWAKLAGQGWIGGPFDMAATADGGLVFTAVRSGSPYPIIIAAELDSAGQLVRARQIMPANGTIYYIPWTIIRTGDGGTILTGSTSDTDGWALKLDKRWEITWQKRFTLPAEGHLYSAKGSRDGGVILQSMRDIVKIHADGSVAWARSYGHQTRRIYLNDVKEAGDGSILVAGTLQGVTDQHPLSMKLGPDGRITNCDLISSKTVASFDLNLVMSPTNVSMLDISPEVRTLDPGYSNPLEVESDLLCGSGVMTACD